MPKSITVELGDRSYEIMEGEGLVHQVGAICRTLGLGPSCLVVTDTNVGPAHGAACMASLEAAGFKVSQAVVPAGETSKSQAQLFSLYSEALTAGLDRKGFIVALGGGVVGDLAGYVAASYLRGIDLVQVPTSIVAMVDSAVGGKTGINLPEGKNLIGAFYQPRAVIVDRETLSTLPEREYVSGLAEVVKYGVIRDASFFELMEDKVSEILAKDPLILGELVLRSCQAKADVVGEDEREGGLRAILNFGHTLGHALEKVAGYGEYLHGEAIAVGMVYAARVSCCELGMAETDAQRLTRLLERLGLPVSAPGYAWPALREAMRVDKKVSGGVPRFVLARKIGDTEFGCEVSEDVLRQCWED